MKFFEISRRPRATLEIVHDRPTTGRSRERLRGLAALDEGGRVKDEVWEVEDVRPFECHLRRGILVFKLEQGRRLLGQKMSNALADGRDLRRCGGQRLDAREARASSSRGPRRLALEDLHWL